jgi:hypothetical protein
MAICIAAQLVTAWAGEARVVINGASGTRSAGITVNTVYAEAVPSTAPTPVQVPAPVGTSTTIYAAPEPDSRPATSTPNQSESPQVEDRAEKCSGYGHNHDLHLCGCWVGVSLSSHFVWGQPVWYNGVTWYANDPYYERVFYGVRDHRHFSIPSSAYRHRGGSDRPPRQVYTTPVGHPVPRLPRQNYAQPSGSGHQGGGHSYRPPNNPRPPSPPSHHSSPSSPPPQHGGGHSGGGRGGHR